MHCVKAFGALFNLLKTYPSFVKPTNQNAIFKHAPHAATTSMSTICLVKKPCVVIRIALHSYGGSADFAKSLMALEKKRCIESKKNVEASGCTDQQFVLFEFYFGFSATVNCGCCGTNQKVRHSNHKRLFRMKQVLAAVPQHRILLETDRGSLGSLLEIDLQYICKVRRH